MTGVSRSGQPAPMRPEVVYGELLFFFFLSFFFSRVINIPFVIEAANPCFAVILQPKTMFQTPTSLMLVYVKVSLSTFNDALLAIFIPILLSTRRICFRILMNCGVRLSYNLSLFNITAATPTGSTSQPTAGVHADASTSSHQSTFRKSVTRLMEVATNTCNYN